MALDDECDAPDGREQEEDAAVHAAQVEGLVLHHHTARHGAQQEAPVAHGVAHEVHAVAPGRELARLRHHARHVGWGTTMGTDTQGEGPGPPVTRDSPP